MSAGKGYTDFHVHHHPEHGRIDAKVLLNQMDRAGLEKIALMSWYGGSLEEQSANIDAVAEVLAEAPERIYGLAWIEPRHKTPLDYLEKVIADKKYRGFKMIPNGWYPCDEQLFPYYRKMVELNAPCLFHSGILYFPTYSSKHCRPVYYEDLIKVDRFRFALAHISWPWTDECLALFGQWRSSRRKGTTSEMFIDTTPGTPPFYREDALKNLMEFGAEDAMLFGTDCLVGKPEDSDRQAETWQERIESDTLIYRKLAVSDKVIEKILRRNFDRFFVV